MGEKRYTDVHVHHLPNGKEITAKSILNAMDKTGLEKIAIISWYGEDLDEQERNIEETAKIISECSDRLYGLAWIEPKHNTPIDSLEKIIYDRKYRGFKMIPNTWYPGEERILPYYEKMAELGVPCLFHSGILYFHTYSSKYCRPVYYEDLIKINKFKFALAHISWPWTDECLALFGQWRALKNKYKITSEMFVDTTPGTPPEYREDALRKLLAFGAENVMLFGTDNTISGQHIDNVTEIWKTHLQKDINIYKKLSVPESTIEKILSANFERFFSKTT